MYNIRSLLGERERESGFSFAPKTWRNESEMASPKNKKARELLKELLSLAELLPTTNRSGLCFVAVVSVAFPFRVLIRGVVLFKKLGQQLSHNNLRLSISRTTEIISCGCKRQPLSRIRTRPIGPLYTPPFGWWRQCLDESHSLVYTDVHIFKKIQK